LVSIAEDPGMVRDTWLKEGSLTRRLTHTSTGIIVVLGALVDEVFEIQTFMLLDLWFDAAGVKEKLRGGLASRRHRGGLASVWHLGLDRLQAFGTGGDIRAQVRPELVLDLHLELELVIEGKRGLVLVGGERLRYIRYRSPGGRRIPAVSCIIGLDSII
jgi:hypothetical protein